MGSLASFICAVWMEDRLGREILDLARHGLDRKDSFTLEICGPHLVYLIKLDGSYIFVSAKALDVCHDWDPLLSVGDTDDGWRTVCSLVRALERHKIQSLERPIHAGTGPNGFVIG
jgi:hypothetical protein